MRAYASNGAVGRTMRILVSAALLLQALALKSEDVCKRRLNEDFEYICPVPNGTIIFGMQKNDYVNVICQGSNINCQDIPQFDFANGLHLGKVGLKSCPPNILICINQIINASYTENVYLEEAPRTIHVDDVINLGPVQSLVFRRANMTSVPYAAIKTMQSLRQLRIGGGHLQLTPHSFEGSPPLTYLELNENHLSSIPPDSFSGLSNLIHLNIWGNNISSINVGAFRGLDNLRKMSLSTSNIVDIEPGAFDDILQLNNLYLMKNQLKILPDGLLGNLKELQNLNITYNKISLAFGERALSNLPSLKVINLTTNKIVSLHGSLFNGSTNIEYIDLRYNSMVQIPENIFNSLRNLKRLYLRRNKITKLPKRLFYDLRRLEYLDLSDNRLDSLNENLFDGLIELKEIHFENNNISYISRGTFQGIPNLEYLYFGSNNLRFQGDYGFLPPVYVSPFSLLTKLKRLDLSNNGINAIAEDWRLYMTQLEYLNLFNNTFNYLWLDEDPSATYFLSPHLTVDLRSNQIESINLSLGPYVSSSTDNSQTRTLLLDDNNFKCDCGMYYVKLRLDGDVYLPNEPKLVMNHAHCFSPVDLKGVPIKHVSKSSLVCKIDETSDNCTTKAKPATNELILSCPRFPSKLPDTKATYLNDFFGKREPTISVVSNEPPASLYGLNVHTLNLSNSGLKTIDFKPTKSLKVLDISNNNITAVPKEFLDANVTLYLANNPLECSCWNADDIDALKNYKYAYNATCESGQALENLDVNGLCNLHYAIAVSVGTFLIIICITVFIAITIYKYFNEIIVYMISRGICVGCVKKIHSDKIYDVFISFAHEDLPLVEGALVPKLEKDFGQKVCVHYRDWVVGEMIPTQINDSVENSRKTVIILSKNFLDSMWANLEFITAHNLTQQENSSRIILILLDESLVHHPNLSRELKAYLRTNTYLLWGDSNFWKKLDRALERNSYRITWLEAFKQKSSENKTTAGALNVQLVNGQLINIASHGPEANYRPEDRV